MPIYEYDCLNCGLRFEYLVRNSQEIITCPKCNHGELRKAVSVFAFSSHDASGRTTNSSSGGCGSCASHNCSSCAK